MRDGQQGEVRQEGDKEEECYLFLGARLKMAGSVDLQGFCSQHLVNISEALMVY